MISSLILEVTQIPGEVRGRLLWSFKPAMSSCLYLVIHFYVRLAQKYRNDDRQGLRHGIPHTGLPQGERMSV